MSRAKTPNKRILLVSGAVAAIIAGVSVAVLPAVISHSGATKGNSTSTAKTQLAIQQPSTNASISYRGENGKSALTLLKQHATVQTKQSSFGEYVVSVNDNDGGGKKYWLFYVNGKESSVGAGAYITKSTDTVEWKLR